MVGIGKIPGFCVLRPRVAASAYGGLVLDEVLGANAAFYDAFEQRSLEAMGHVWEHSERVVCVHPGWPILRGWPVVEESWRRIFDGPQRNQFIVTNESAQIIGDLGWVTLEENLVDRSTTATVAATNVYVRSHDRWRMLLHHGSPVGW